MKTYAAPPAPWALRVIGRRGPFLRHAALQTLAVVAGAAPDMSRVPTSVSALRTGADSRPVTDRENQVIILEN
jgi:hypothetical protein